MHRPSASDILTQKPPTRRDRKVAALSLLVAEEHPYRSHVIAAVDEMFLDLDSLGGIKDKRIEVLKQHFVALVKFQLEGCRKYIREFDMETSDEDRDQDFVKHVQALEEKVAKLTAPA